MSESRIENENDLGGYTPYRLPLECTGPQHSQGLIYVHPRRVLSLDLDYCIYLRAVRVGVSWNDDGLDFWRATCYQYLPQPPRSVADFVVPETLSYTSPINVYILPPMSPTAALSNVGCASSANSTVVTVRRGSHVQCFSAERDLDGTFIDIEEHRQDVFCVVHLKDRGVYEADQIFSSDGRALISKTSLLFAPSAWKHGATVLSNRGRVGDKTRLYCLLRCGDLVEVDVDSRFVVVADGWSSLKDDGEPW
ncbi:hypothetical protein C8R47DRAFT_1211017 [Mycena vitilis]|nr:hypothetical protein C8R47DRAFT_1211017 [Mycena vitilis]